MARRRSVTAQLNKAARAAASAEKSHIAAEEREQKALEKKRKELDKAQKDHYKASRLAQADELNREVESRVQELQAILSRRGNGVPFSFQPLRRKLRPEVLSDLLSYSPKPPDEAAFLGAVKPPTFLGALLPGAKEKHELALERAREAFGQAEIEHKEALRELAAKRNAYIDAIRAENAEIQRHNDAVDELQDAYLSGHTEAIEAFADLNLDRSQYPEGFPQAFKLAYVADSRQLVIEYTLPAPDVIPETKTYKYVQARDQIDEKAFPVREVKALYQDIIAATTLRTLAEAFLLDKKGPQGANPTSHIDAVAFNGIIDSVDPATGQDIRVCVISVRATRGDFEGINLDRVDMATCLRSLSAAVSTRPTELAPVKPIVAFEMVDRRFVEQQDILSDLESRPNLYDLDPFEFENLCANLFEKMGFDSRQTQSSSDGGVDAVVFDTRPIVGGKIVIQAKRYKNTVGVSAVRDLYGTMLNEGANKGILISTSGYGPGAFEFAKDKPIELVDGGGLLYLLEQNGIHARIELPK